MLDMDSVGWQTSSIRYSRSGYGNEANGKSGRGKVEEGKIDFNGGGLANVNGQAPRLAASNANSYAERQALSTVYVTEMRQATLSQRRVRRQR